MTKDKQKILIDSLVEKKILKSEDIAKVQKEVEDGKRVREVLENRTDIDIEKVVEVEAEIYGLNYVDLNYTKVNGDALNVVSAEASENYGVICFEKVGKNIKIGIIDPDNYKAREAINFLAKEQGYFPEYYLISEASFEKVFSQYKNLEREISSALETKAEKERREQEEAMREVEEEKTGLDEVMKSAPVAKIVSVIIRHAVEGKASDIHIEPAKDESRIRYRIDGVLHTSLVLPKNIHSSLVARIKVLADLKLDETRIPQDGRIRMAINQKEIDFRVSILPLTGEEKVVMRILDTTRGAPNLQDLGYTGRSLRVIENAIKDTTGMLLVTGPTGSGKSTTLFSVLNMLNREGVNISTLEDPVEYFIKGVNQSQIRPEIGFTFASGLRSLLRQDPDIIMVGEIRDNETAELAIHAGLTGHFVLSTLHTNSAVGTVPRLIDMKVEPFLLGSTLNAVVAQRLARKICEFCREELELPEDVFQMAKKQIEQIPKNILEEELPDFGGIENLSKNKFYQGKGCSKCGKTGYSGRVGVVEVLEITKELQGIVMDEDEILTIDKVKENQDFTTMMQDGIIKALKGFTSMEEILRIMRD